LVVGFVGKIGNFTTPKQEDFIVVIDGKVKMTKMYQVRIAETYVNRCN